MDNVADDISAALPCLKTSEDEFEAQRDAIWQKMPEQRDDLWQVIEEEEMMRAMIEFVQQKSTAEAEKAKNDSDSNEMEFDDDSDSDETEAEDDALERWWKYSLDSDHRAIMKRLICERHDPILPAWKTQKSRNCKTQQHTNSVWHKEKMLVVGTWSLITGKLMYYFDLRPGADTFYRKWIGQRFEDTKRSYLSGCTTPGTVLCSEVHTRKALQKWNKRAMRAPSRSLPSLPALSIPKISIYARTEFDEVLMNSKLI